MSVVVGVLAVLAALVLGLTELLLPRLGVTGAAVAWLVAQSVVAGALLWRRSWWFPSAGPAGGTARPSTAPAPARIASVPGAAVRAAVGSAVTFVRGLLPIRRLGLLSRPADWRAARRVRLDPAPVLRRAAQGRSDVLVLRSDQRAGPALAVKLPRNARAAATLAHEWEVLRELAADDRLGEWRQLLPPAVSYQPDGPGAMVAEGWVPGVSAEGLLHRNPQDAPQVARASLGAIAGLHHATGHLESLDGRLDTWLAPRLASLADQVPWCRQGVGAEGLDGVRRRLRDGLLGHPVRVAWTHGDYAPGNVLLSTDLSRVTGVVDWGSATADGPADIDAYTFVLALRAELTGQAIGALVAEIVRTGELAPQDHGLLAAAALAGPADERDGAERDSAALPLLTWLWHVANNLDKSPRYGRSRWWVAANVVPVLTELARWP